MNSSFTKFINSRIALHLDVPDVHIFYWVFLLGGFIQSNRSRGGKRTGLKKIIFAETLMTQSL
jgi:hypothetical protein